MAAVKLTVVPGCNVRTFSIVDVNSRTGCNCDNLRMDLSLAARIKGRIVKILYVERLRSVD